MNIEVIAGSPRKGSLSHRVALHLAAALKEKSAHNIGLIDLQEFALPPIQAVWGTADKAPEQHRALAERVFSAHAFVLVSPEYNGGYSPAMKNLIDHFPKQVRKTFAIATASPGIMGGMRAAQQLLQLVPALFGVASPSLLIVPAVDKKFAEDGSLTDEPFSKNVHDFITDFVWLAERVTDKK